MDLLDMLALADSPSMDTTTGDPIPRYQRCPDCRTTAYGPCGAINATTTRLPNRHWRTRSSCNCGRLAWDDIYDGRKYLS